MIKKDIIKALTDRETARTKLPIFFGSRDNYYHPIREVIANATDEINNNFEEGEIFVTLSPDRKTITCRDTGRGIPIGEKNNLELIFLTLFAGGKYEESSNINTGTNGVGNACTVFTSGAYQVRSWYGGKKYSCEFFDGGLEVGELQITKAYPGEHGTEIQFRLDEEMYTHVEFEVEEVRSIVRRFCVGCNKITAYFIHGENKEKFHYDSIEEYYLEQVNQSTCKEIVGANEELTVEGEIFKIGAVIGTSSDPLQETYLNLTYLKENGSIYDGAIAGVKTFANKYCKAKKHFPKGVNGFKDVDIESSVSMVVNVLSSNVEFCSQTKFSTAKRLYRDLTKKYIEIILDVQLLENPKEVEKFIKHLLLVQKHNEASSKAKQQLKKKLSEKVEGIGNKVDGLVDCREHGEIAELFICEGQSALGSVVLARDATFQAAIAIRGKILNCLKTDYETIFKNQIITDLVRVMGCGIETDKKNKDLDSFDITKLRYGKIIITTDADSDGYQIACLIMTMIYKLMPQLILEGRVYIAKTPLYELVFQDGSRHYFFSEEEKEREIGNIKGKYTIARSKGLGENSPELMAETAMNPETRNIERVIVPNSERMKLAFDTWMGTEVANRKEFIEENLSLYINEI